MVENYYDHQKTCANIRAILNKEVYVKNAFMEGVLSYIIETLQVPASSVNKTLYKIMPLDKKISQDEITQAFNTAVKINGDNLINKNNTPVDRYVNGDWFSCNLYNMTKITDDDKHDVYLFQLL